MAGTVLRCALVAAAAMTASALHLPGPWHSSRGSVAPRLGALAGMRGGGAPPGKISAKRATRSPSGEALGHERGVVNEGIELCIYLSAWYWLNTYYNIFNKRSMNLLGGSRGGLALCASAAQLLVGLLWVLPLWILGVRKTPDMTARNWQQMAPVGLWTAGAHGASVMSLGSTAVSLAQVLKTWEPVFSAATEAALLRKLQPWQVYVSLIPIITGVCFAIARDLSLKHLTLRSVVAAMLANQFAAFKILEGKAMMIQPWVQAMGPVNQYDVIHICALLWGLPIALVAEGPASFRNYRRCVRE